MSLDEFTNEVLEFIPIKSQAKFSSYFCFVFTSATSIKAPRRISGYCMYSIHPAGSQRIHMYPIEIETEIHEFFFAQNLVWHRYRSGTGKYRRVASTAALAEPPSPYRRIHSWEARLNTKTIDPSSRSALVSASSSELLKKYYVKKAKSKTFCQ